MKPTRCKVCRSEFVKRSITHKCCGPDCAALFAKSERERKERKEIREAKQRSKTRGQWAKEAQVAFNAFIRERDKSLPCISCGRFHQGAYDAGHYRSVGAAPELRFHEDNCHRQCVPCNKHKSGNAIEYRIRLVERVGLDRVTFLEGPQEPKHYSIEDLKQIKAQYKQKLKQLQGA